MSSFRRPTVPRRRLLQAGAALLLAPATARAVSVEGHAYDEVLRLDGTTLRLTGAGVRAVAWFKGFTVGLWVAEPSTRPDALLGQAGPKRLRLRMLVDVPAAELVKALRRGVQKNHAEDEQARLAPAMARLEAVIGGLGALRTGESLDLDHLPGRGLQVLFQGQPRGEPVPGDEAFRAVLRIFIGNRPADERLKAALLAARGRPATPELRPAPAPSPR
jgi:hypothetical protein